MTDRLFPLLCSREERKIYGVPKAVPWGLVVPHDLQAQRNHSQSLERLAERGGLHPVELYYVCHDLPYAVSGTIALRAAVAWLLTAMVTFQKTQAGGAP